MSLQKNHAPNCAVSQGRCCTCGFDDLWEDVRSRLRELARKSKCPRDGGKVTYGEQTNELTCVNGHKLEVKDEQ